MNTFTINNSLQVSLPEGFSEMTPEELKQGYLSENQNMWGSWDKERHIIISIFWHKSSGLLVKLAKDAENVAKSTEKKLKHGMRFNDYHFEGFFPADICGHNAHGFRYSYKVQGIEQTAETIVMLHENVCYTFYYYARKDGAAEDHQIFEDMLGTAEMV